MVLFLILVTLTVACACTAVALRVFRLIMPAKVAAAATTFAFVLTVGSVGLGEWRYQDCVDEVEAACPDAGCADDYDGPFILDCERMRVFG